MAGSTFGNILKVTTFGESHGPAVGAVLDGFPAGISLTEEDIQPYLDRRKPGSSSIATQRQESDKVEILSGTFEGRTTGTPITLLIHNHDQHSSDYEELKDCYRPGHADYTYAAKYGIRDWRGGGRSSGRETAGRVAAGACAARFLKELGVDLCFYTAAIGDVFIDRSRFNPDLITSVPTAMPDASANLQALELIEKCRTQKDSVGGMVEGRISGVPAGIGDPVFNKLDALLAQALMSIGAVKAVGIGDGVFAASRTGSENNDGFYVDDEGIVRTHTNHAGGILGGISDGEDIIVSAFIKPTPSIAQEQHTITTDHEDKLLSVHGRHDPVIVPRAVVVCECMSALVILDAMLANMTSKAESVRRFYAQEDF